MIKMDVTNNFLNMAGRSSPDQFMSRSTPSPVATAAPNTSKASAKPVIQPKFSNTKKTTEPTENFAEYLQPTNEPAPQPEKMSGPATPVKAQSKVELPFADNQVSEAPVDSEVLTLDAANIRPESRLMRAEYRPIENAEDKEHFPENPAILRFFAAMQSQLGISPEKIVEAMTSLSTEELMESPEQTMNQVLNNLGLVGGKRELAANLYQQMLYESAQAKMREGLVNKNQSADVALLTPKESRRRSDGKRVDSMNDQFFMRSKVQNQTGLPMNQQSETTKLPLGAPLNQSPQTAMAKSMSSVASDSFTATNATADSIPENTFFSDNSAVSANHTSDKVLPHSMNDGFKLKMQEMNTNPMNSAIPAQDKFPMGQEANVPSQLNNQNLDTLAQTYTMPTPSAQNFDVGATELTKDSAAKNTNDQIQNWLRGMLAETKSEADSDSASTDDQGDKADTFKHDLTGLVQQSTHQGTPSTFFAPELKMTEAQQNMNLRNIVQQSQVLIRKGGGEMKVKLAPEGMGQVDLKVKVEQGQVKIEMVTDNAETKRLLETGINDLKVGLHGQKLHVDSIRVDMSQSAGKEWTNTNSDSSGQQSRDLAQSFMQNFRQDRQEYLENFFNSGIPKGYREQKRQTIQPINVQRADGKSRRLDLVA